MKQEQSDCFMLSQLAVRLKKKTRAPPVELHNLKGGEALGTLELKSPNWREHLLSLPEAGMGLQIVDITLKDGRVIRRVLVYNGEVLDLPEGFGDLEEEDLEQIKTSGDGG